MRLSVKWAENERYIFVTFMVGMEPKEITTTFETDSTMSVKASFAKPSQSCNIRLNFEKAQVEIEAMDIAGQSSELGFSFLHHIQKQDLFYKRTVDGIMFKISKQTVPQMWDRLCKEGKPKWLSVDWERFGCVGDTEPNGYMPQFGGNSFENEYDDDDDLLQEDGEEGEEEREQEGGEEQGQAKEESVPPPNFDGEVGNDTFSNDR